MHEISHTLGIGQTAAFDTKCAANDWATATPLLRSWDGASAKINCGGGHIWPYGLNVSISLRLAAHLVLCTFIPVLLFTAWHAPNACFVMVILPEAEAGLEPLRNYSCIRSRR